MNSILNYYVSESGLLQVNSNYNQDIPNTTVI